MFIIQKYTIFCRLISSGVRWKKEQLKAFLTPKSLSPQESQFAGLMFLVKTFRFFRDLVKNPWEFFSHKGIAFFLSCAHVLYMIPPLVIQAHFDLLPFSGKPDFHKIMEILSLCLFKNTSFLRL